jgi:hypothetical protein
LPDSSAPSLIKAPTPKKAWSVGKHTVVIIDSAIVKRLGITEHETMFSEEVMDGGIFLRLVRRETGIEH